MNKEEANKALLRAQTVEETRAALAAGADVNAKDLCGDTALMFASTAEQTKLLIEAGADVNAKNDILDQTVLMKARTAEQTDLLIKAGAYVDAKDIDGKPVIAFASSTKQIDLLLNAGADSTVTWYEKDYIYDPDDNIGDPFDPFDTNYYTYVETDVETNIYDVLERIKLRNSDCSDKRSHIEKRKENIRLSQSLRKAILKHKPEEKVSGVALADEIAKDVISGKEKRTITPEVGKEIRRNKALEK